MPSFAYHAIDNRGTRHTGHADAPTPRALALALEERGLVVVEVAANHDSPAANSEAYRHSNRASLIDVTRALAGLLSAGLPLSRAIAAAASTSQRPMSEHLSTVRDRVAHGDPLATALAAHGETFPPLYLGLVRAGERSGDLAGAFTRLASQLEREDELRSKLLSAAIYPALLAVVGTTAVLVLLLFVLPRFAGVLEGAGAHLPRSTQVLLTASAAARHYWLLLLLPPVAVTLENPPYRLGAKRIVPSRFHAPPPGLASTGQMFSGAPPVIRTRFKYLPPKNAICWLSGDQKGADAPSDP